MLDVYACYKRKTFVGPNAGAAGDRPLRSGLSRAVRSRRTSSPRPIRIPAADYAHAAIEPTKRLFAAARAAGLPSSIRPATPAAKAVRTSSPPPSAYRPPVDAVRLRDPAGVQAAAGDVVITKQRASVFYGTPLIAHLTQLGIQTLIVCGESTSGCVRATAVDAYSNGFHVVLVEECCFDRSALSHKVNLFDMHHKYTDVMHVDEVVAHLEGLGQA